MLLAISAFGQDQAVDIALNQLNVTLLQAQKYDDVKLKKIDSLRQILQSIDEDKLMLKIEITTLKQ